MNFSPRLVISLCSAVTLALALWLFGRPDPVSPRSAPAVVADAPLAVVPLRPASSLVEAPVEYAPRMPTGPGIAIVGNNGQIVGDAVQVAVPDSFGQIQYLPKRDPRAVRYEEEQRAEQSRIVQDEGPRQVNTRALTVKNSVTARQRSVPIQVKP